MRMKHTVRPIFSLSLRPICILLIAGVGVLTAVAYNVTQQRVTAQTERTFNEITDSYVRQLTQHVEGYGDVLYATRGLFAATPINNASWKQFIAAQYTFERNPEVEVIAYAETVTEPQKAAYLARVKKELDSNTFAIHPAQSGQQVVITYGQENPSKSLSDSGVTGFDLNSEHMRRAALSQAQIGKHIVATAPVQLENTHKLGFLLILPLTTTAGTNAYSVAAIDTNSLVDQTIGQYLRQYQDSSVKLTDITDRQPAPIYDKTANLSGPLLTRKAALQVGDRKWQVSFETSRHTMQSVTERFAAAGVLTGGIITIFTIALVFYALVLRKKLSLTITG